MRFSLALATAPLAAVCLMLPISAHAQQRPMGPDRMVLTAQDAVLLMPPAVVADGAVTHAEWSGDGKNVLALRTRIQFPDSLMERPTFEAAVVLWNKESQRSRTVWRAVASEEPRNSLNWLGRSSVALGILDIWKRPTPLVAPGKSAVPPPPPIRQRWLARLDARTGAFRFVSQLPDDAELRNSTSRPIAFVATSTPNTLRFVRADGTMTAPLTSLAGDPLGLPAGDPLGLPAWNETGDAVVVGRVVREAKQPEIVWYAIDPATGRTREKVNRPGSAAATEQPENPSGLRLVQRQAALTEAKTTAQVYPLWLETADEAKEGGQPRALISANAEWGKFSPGGDAVLYGGDSAAWVCSLKRVPKEVFLAARAAARRQMLMSNGKQLAVGFLMYAQDYDETLPDAGSDIQSLLTPYLKNDALFGGFVYTFPGGKLSDVPEPSKTLLGHIPAEGGQIQVFVDGHVRFEPNR